MNEPMKTVLWLTPLCAVFGLSQCIYADTVTATLTGLAPYVFPTVHLTGAPGGEITGGTGNILWNATPPNPPPASVSSPGPAGSLSINPGDFTGTAGFGTFCIDLIQEINFGSSYTFVETPLASAPQSGAFPTGLPSTGMGLAKATELDTLYAENFSNLSTPDEFEAFQLAIWNIVYDTDDSVTNPEGSFYIVSGFDPDTINIENLANGYLHGAVDGPAMTFSGTLIALVGENGAQDQIFAQPNGPIIPLGSGTPVPAPQTWLAGGVLLGVTMLARRKNGSLTVI